MDTYISLVIAVSGFEMDVSGIWWCCSGAAAGCWLTFVLLVFPLFLLESAVPFAFSSMFALFGVDFQVYLLQLKLQFLLFTLLHGGLRLGLPSITANACP